MSGQSQNNMLPNTGTESGNQSNNNIYQGPAEKGFSGDNIANGYGLATPAALKSAIETFPGSEASEQMKLKQREAARFSALQSSGAMSMTVPITNAGIVLDGIVNVGYGEGGSKPSVQGGALK